MYSPSLRMDNLVLSTFSLCVICVVFHQYVANPLWANEETTTESKISPVEEFLNDQTEKPRHDGEITLKTSDAPKVYPGDYLFQVSVGVKFVGANFKESEGIERRVARSIKRLVREKLSTFSSFKELFLLTIKRINAPGLLFVYWLYFSPGGEDIYIPLESRINQLLFKSVSNLRHGKAVTFSVSVEDVDECISGLSMCDLEANCLNAFGYYSCQCTKGFEDPSSTASSTGCVKNVKPESGSLPSLGLQEILGGVIPCIILILAIILTLLFMMSKRQKRISSLDRSSDGPLPILQLFYPQEEMRSEELLVFESDKTKNNRIFFKKIEQVEVVAGHQLDCTEFKTVQKQLTVETPRL